MKLFCISANRFEERPITVTRTFPELDQIVVVCNEKLPKFFGNDSQVYLKGVDRRVEDESSYMNRVSDNNDF